jgi:hypothetical protein
MDANLSTATVMTIALARQDMLENVEDLAPVPYYVNKNGSYYQRQTLNEKRLGGFWVMYKWGLKNYELHVHYSDSGKIKTDTVKVTGSNMKGGQLHLDSQQLAAVRAKIKNPPSP